MVQSELKALFLQIRSKVKLVLESRAEGERDHSLSFVTPPTDQFFEIGT